MTKNELIAALQAIPGNPEVMVNRGEWGPSQLLNCAPTLIQVLVQGESENWEVAFPEVPAGEGEVRQEVILL
jgi:hypothetical protein